MPSLKMIKRRIGSVSNTQQIMKAMNLVAASKLQKAKEQQGVVRPLFDHIQRVMDGVQASEGAADSVFTQKREVRNIAVLVITGDRGLCGGYNHNMAKEAMALLNANEGKQEKIIALGMKGWEYFRRRGKNVVQRYVCIQESASYDDAEQIGKMLVSMYLSGEADEVYIAYTQFETILTHHPRVIKILPLGEASGGTEAEKPKEETAHVAMSYDPDVNTFIEYAVPMYLNTVIYGAMVEANVCEQAARMTSMDSATRNASEIIDDLTLVFNRKRQSVITQEITEIVSGANALQ